MYARLGISYSYTLTLVAANISNFRKCETLPSYIASYLGKQIGINNFKGVLFIAILCALLLSVAMPMKISIGDLCPIVAAVTPPALRL